MFINEKETEFNQEKVDVEGKQLRIKDKNRVEGKEMKRYQTYSVQKSFMGG